MSDCSLPTRSEPQDHCRSFRVELPDGRAYWTVVDADYLKVDLADRFLFDLRFGRDRAESTSRMYAGELTRFLSWCGRTGRSLEDGATHLSRFVLFLRTTPTARPGAGQGRPPGAARINHVLAVIREFFKHAAAAGSVDGGVLTALYEIADDRHLPAELRPEGGRAALSGPAPPPPAHRRDARPSPSTAAEASSSKPAAPCANSEAGNTWARPWGRDGKVYFVR